MILSLRLGFEAFDRQPSYYRPIRGCGVESSHPPHRLFTLLCVPGIVWRAVVVNVPRNGVVFVCRNDDTINFGVSLKLDAAAFRARARMPIMCHYPSEGPRFSNKGPLMPWPLRPLITLIGNGVARKTTSSFSHPPCLSLCVSLSLACSFVHPRNFKFLVKSVSGVLK